MAVANITPKPEDCDGHIVTCFIEHTSAGATAETITIPSGCPYLDLDKAHPIMSGIFSSSETDITDSFAITPAHECARAATPDTADGDFSIQTKSTVKVYESADKNGIYGLTYWGKGIKA